MTHLEDTEHNSFRKSLFIASASLLEMWSNFIKTIHNLFKKYYKSLIRKQIRIQEIQKENLKTMKKYRCLIH
jgi:hypothetical protein